jgi:hypothetical protein
MNNEYNQRGEDREIIVCVIDGMGGGIGAEIISLLRRELPEPSARPRAAVPPEPSARPKAAVPPEPSAGITIIALGTNAAATERMLQARAHRGATGENAIRVNVRTADFIMGPLGIAFPNALLGEISPAIAESLSLAPGVKILIPVPQNHYHLVGLMERPLGELIAQGVAQLKSYLF